MPYIKDVFENNPKIPDRNLEDAVLAARRAKIDAVIVLDDDPTGTQTVHDIPVLTEWSRESVLEQFNSGTELFYILTNSRSLTEKNAVELTNEIGSNIKAAASENNTRFWVISRSDSTLRGHYPAEVQALQQSLALNGVEFIIPCFFEGGRYTVKDIHYVRQGDQLIPAAETPYAKDAVFGYNHSNLRFWIEEKTNGLVDQSLVQSISLEDLREQSLEKLTTKISKFRPGDHCVVNATCYEDLNAFCLALLSSGISPLFRTAASLVAALGCLGKKDLLKGEEIVNGKGGLIVVGSYVSTTTEQLNHLLQNNDRLMPIELEVNKILGADDSSFVNSIIEQIEVNLQGDNSIVLYTSRKLITGTSEQENQDIAHKVSSTLTKIVSELKTRPGFLITKGGITSSDLATKALGVKKALVVGQIIEGVPVWKLGGESKFPGMHQIIFPGNVGDSSALTEVFNLLTRS